MSYEGYFCYGWEQSGLSLQDISGVLVEWNELRRKRRFAEADALRERMAEHGVIFEADGRGSRWRMDLFELHRRRGTLSRFFPKSGV